MQIMKCQSDEGTTTAVTKQADGKHLRYILGNGRCVNCNPDGTFKERLNYSFGFAESLSVGL
ncbi:hypothetical protein [Citreimonas salinaria]|nr:hypothetical protein [Citreimonas salinaria]